MSDEEEEKLREFFKNSVYAAFGLQMINDMLVDKPNVITDWKRRIENG